MCDPQSLCDSVGVHHLCQQLCTQAVEVHADAQRQSLAVLEACEALIGHLLTDDVDWWQAQLI